MPALGAPSSAASNIEDNGVKIADFIKQIDLINKNGFSFINANNFEHNLVKLKSEKKVLLTIDDGFKSFYDQAWPILRDNKIPFLLFVNTREIGSSGYMTCSYRKP